MDINQVPQGTTFIPGNGRDFHVDDLPELVVEVADLAKPVGASLVEVDEERERELCHAFDLREARDSLVALYLELPAGCRDHVLEGSLQGRRQTKRWSLDRVERCYGRLLRYEAMDPSPVVSRAAERARVFKSSLDAAREALVVENVQIVPHIVKRFSNGTIPFADLVQDGHVGLLRAVDRFDPDRGYRFSTYAYWWIRRSLSESFTNHSRLIRLPDSLRENLRSMRGARDSLQEELGRRPTPEEIAERMDVSLKKIKKLMHVAPEPCSIDDLGGDQDESWSVMIDGSGDADPLESVLGREIRQQAKEALEQLDPRERRVIRLRFGFEGDKGMTLSQIGKAVGLSRERVRQIERIALDKIHDWAFRTGVCAA
jgi:RNA polymerase sigma factor (sigma-70 family)